LLNSRGPTSKVRAGVEGKGSREGGVRREEKRREVGGREEIEEKWEKMRRVPEGREVLLHWLI